MTSQSADNDDLPEARQYPLKCGMKDLQWRECHVIIKDPLPLKQSDIKYM